MRKLTLTLAVASLSIALGFPSGLYAQAGPGSKAKQADEMVAQINRALKADQAATDRVEAALAQEDAARSASRMLALEMPMLELQERKLQRNRAVLLQKIAKLEDAQKRYAEISLLIEGDLFETADRLKTQVAQTADFLTVERRERAAFLATSAGDPALSIGEKLRRTVEALNAEASYGSTVEAINEKTKIDGRPAVLTVIRTGRLGLYALTLDRKTAGRWLDETTGFESDEKLLPVVNALLEAIDAKVKNALPLLPISQSSTFADDQGGV